MSGRVPPSSRARTRSALSKNPAVKRAASLFERFTGHEAEALGKIKVKPLPRVAVFVGDLDFVGYTTIRDGVKEKYIHKFTAKDRPALCVSPDGKQILIVGGNYTFTERGIVDMSDKSR